MPNKILVLNGQSYAEAVSGLGEIEVSPQKFFRNTKNFKLVLFTGGADVSPEYYGDKSPDNVCWVNPGRDKQEQEIINWAFANDIPVAGICRGLQFINVYAGGRMMHDISGHGGGIHKMATADGNVIDVNSLHHQMVIPPDNLSIVIGWSAINLSKRYIGYHDKEESYSGLEIEAVVYPAIKGFGVQYHPEMMSSSSGGYKFFYNMVEHALSAPWEDFTAHHRENKTHANNSLPAVC